MRLRSTFRARKTINGVHFNFGKRGLTSVSASAGPITINPTRRSVSLDTPGPGSLRVVADDERAPRERESVGYLIGSSLARLLFRK